MGKNTNKPDNTEKTETTKNVDQQESPVKTETNDVLLKNDAPEMEEEIDEKSSHDGVIMTPEEQALALRISRKQDHWDSIREEDMVDFSLSQDRYALPPEAKKLQDNKQYAFRFIAMNPRRIDEMTNAPPPAKWWICNRTTAPFLKDYFDPIHGGLQKEDQIMVMKPWHLHERHEGAKRQTAREKDKKGSLNSRDGKKDELEPGVVRTESFAGRQHKISNADVVMEASDI